MTVIPFRQRHTGGESAPVLALIRKAAIRGTFRAPSGRTGRTEFVKVVEASGC